MPALTRRAIAACGGALTMALTPARTAVAEDAMRACIDASTQGQTLRQQGHLLAARDRMIRCARDACPSVVRSHCARWLGEIDDRLPSVVVRVQDASGADLVDARVLIDGQAGKLDGRAVPLDPGEHVVAVEHGGARKEERVIVVEGEASRLVMLRLAPSLRASAPEASPAPSLRPFAPEASPAPAPSSRATRVPLGAWILGGVGLAALGAATYFGLAAKAQLDDLDGSCSPNCSDPQTRPGRADALAFDVLLGASGAALGAAVVWALAFPSPVEIQPTAHGGTVSFTLRY
jgi:hypothetical protein